MYNDATADITDELRMYSIDCSRDSDAPIINVDNIVPSIMVDKEHAEFSKRHRLVTSFEYTLVIVP